MLRMNSYKTWLLLLLSSLLLSCSSSPKYTNDTQGIYCANPQRYAGQAVGSGHCVALIQTCSPAPHTKYWRPSIPVKGNVISPGSIIATFKNGRYPNKSGYHAAIYISQNKQGIWVWDQWVGKPVHKRLIRFKGGKGSASNDGDRYKLVRFIR